MMTCSQRAADSTMSKLRLLPAGILLLAIALALVGAAVSAEATAVQNVVTMQIPDVSTIAPAQTSNVHCHVMPVHKPGGRATTVRPSCDHAASMAAAAPVGPSSSDCNDGCGVVNYMGGPTITSAQQTFIFLNCASTCWGNPSGFLSDLFSSTFIHVIDQYMEPSVLTTSGRYTTNSTAVSLTGSEPHTLLDSQLQTIILNAVKAQFPSGGGGGYNRMYSMFLPSGQDLCFDGSGSLQCYCPDSNCGVGNTFAFCAYHSSFDATDAVGNPIHLIYQAMPYQDVNTIAGSCQVADGPNGAVIDSTNNVFSHEINETISDPDGDAWWRSSDGNEIADICAWASLSNPIYLHADAYEIQMEYSNAAQGCVGFFPYLAASHVFNGFNAVGEDVYGADEWSVNFNSDIMWRNTSGGTALWFLNGGQILQSGGFGTVPTTWSIVGQRDFNGDGNADLLWRDSSGDVAIWLMNGLTITSGVGLGNVPTTWSIVGTGDLNGDGVGDLLWRDTAGDIAVWFMGTGGTVSSTAGLGNVSTTWTIVGDDNNGNILWHDSSGNYVVWHVSGPQVTGTASLGNVPLATWQVAGIGDFNGDGITDILWRDTAGDTAIWFLNSTFGVQSTAGLGNVPTTWSVAQTGDYNSDGKSDILWVDNTGNVALWFMNGGTVASTAGFGNVGTTWSVQALNAE